MTVRPYEARSLPPINTDDPAVSAAAIDLLIAVNGFPYLGEATDAVMYALRWLRANPDHTNILLGRTA